VTIEEQLDDAFSGVGVDGFIHAVEVDGDSEVGLQSDDAVIMASVFKIPVLLELVRQAWDGSLDMKEKIVVTPQDRVMGPTGLSLMLDDAELSLRDLAFLMMSISDNTATDVVMRRVGLDKINQTLASLGLANTVLVGDCNLLLSSLIEDLGLTGNDITSRDWAEIDPEAYARCRALRAEETTRSTPREMATLLRMIWRDEAARPEACAEARRILALQAWRDRLTAGFSDEVLVAGKTGTLPAIRNEVGVVQYPDGRKYAVAVFTHAHSYEWRRPPIDAVIGKTARLAVEYLRSE
jgi:beta-lactamase class A